MDLRQYKLRMQQIGSLHIPCSAGGRPSISGCLFVCILATPPLSLLPVTNKKGDSVGSVGAVVVCCGLRFLTGAEVISGSVECAEI